MRENYLSVTFVFIFFLLLYGSLIICSSYFYSSSISCVRDNTFSILGDLCDNFFFISLSHGRICFCFLWNRGSIELKYIFVFWAFTTLSYQSQLQPFSSFKFMAIGIHLCCISVLRVWSFGVAMSLEKFSYYIMPQEQEFLK